MANVVEEWLSFDLDASFIDRRIGLSPALFDDGRRRELATRDAPSLRFLYGLSGVIMWHPDAEAQCATGWVRMTPESLEASTGLAIDPEQSFALESLQVLAEAPSSPELVTNDEAGTTYVIQVPGGTGLKASAPLLDDRDVTDVITRDERPALVRLPRDGGPIEIEVDLTYALAAASAGKDLDATRMTLRWLLTPVPGPVATTLPAEVADPATCEPDRG